MRFFLFVSLSYYYYIHIIIFLFFLLYIQIQISWNGKTNAKLSILVALAIALFHFCFCFNELTSLCWNGTNIDVSAYVYVVGFLLFIKTKPFTVVVANLILDYFHTALPNLYYYFVKTKQFILAVTYLLVLFYFTFVICVHSHFCIGDFSFVALNLSQYTCSADFTLT